VGLVPELVSIDHSFVDTDSSSDAASHTHSARRPLPHSSFVFSKRKLQKLCVGRWGPVSLSNVCAEFSSNL